MPWALSAAIAVSGWPPTALAQNPAQINIVVVEGEGATSTARQKVSHDPVVRVEDDDHRPLADSAVVFALPASGTSGEFPNASKTLTVMTDRNGLAAARGLRANEIPGKLQIYVTASFHGVRATALINQFVEPAAGTKPRPADVQTSHSGGKLKWVILGIVAAGGAGAGVYFGRHTSTPTPVSITAGTVAFGSPR